MPYRKSAVFTTATSDAQLERNSPRSNSWAGSLSILVAVQRRDLVLVCQSHGGFLVFVHLLLPEARIEYLVCGPRLQIGFAVGTDKLDE